MDVLIGPTSPTPAFKLGERTANPLAMYLSDIYTITANLAGIPGLSIPCGLTKSNLPIGMQLLAPAFAEEKLLAHRPGLRARDGLASEEAGVILMPSDFAKLNLGLTAADLDQAWKDRLEDAQALDAAARHGAVMGARLYALEIYLKFRDLSATEPGTSSEEA